MKHYRRATVAYALIALLLVLIAVRQGVVIAEYGVGGWLEGKGPHQTEWEVRGAIAVVTLLAAVLVGIGWRAGEGLAGWWRDARLIRAIHRERHEIGEHDR